MFDIAGRLPGIRELIAGALVALPLIAAFAAPRVLEGWATVMGAGVAVLIAAAAVLTGQVRPSRQVMVVVGAGGAAVLWLAVRSAFAANPRVSLLGMLGAGDGALVWLAAWAVFACAALLGPGSTLKALRATIAVTGAVAAVAGLLDLAGLIPHPDSWATEAAGLLGTSNALGMYLVLGLGASVSWALSKSTRAYGIACAVLCAAGLAATESRAALVAAGVATVAVAVVALSRSPRSRALTAGTVAALILLVVGGGIAWSASASGSAAQAATRILSDRPALWQAALAQVGQAPLIGSGSQMFSAYYTWTVDATRLFGVDAIGSFSPHSVALDWLLAGGVVGLALALVALVALVGAIVPRLGATPRADPVWPLIAALVAWALASSGAVTEPVALLAAAGLAGALLASTGGREEQPARAGMAQLALAGAAAIGLAALLVLTPAYALGSRAFAWDPRDVGPEELPRYVDAYQRTGDPLYVKMGLTSLLAQTSGDYPAQLADDARTLARLALRDARWQIDVATLGAAAEALRSTEDSETAYARVEAFLDAGNQADPGSSVWTHLREREARRLGVER